MSAPTLDPLFDTALCIAGANASPPEDVGGEPGYADFVAAMADPNHPEHHDMLEWYGAPFDPTAFDISAGELAVQVAKTRVLVAQLIDRVGPGPS